MLGPALARRVHVLTRQGQRRATNKTEHKITKDAGGEMLSRERFQRTSAKKAFKQRPLSGQKKWSLKLKLTTEK